MSDQPAEPVDDAQSSSENDLREPMTSLDDTETSASTTPAPPTTRVAPKSARDGLIASLLIAAAVIVADQITKQIVVGHLRLGVPVHVIWTLQWNLTHNSGMAFSRGTGIGPILGALALVVVVVLVVSLGRHGTRSSKLAVGLVIGGAVGNLCDRLFRGDGWLRGSVVDFVDFQWFPVFNVADSAISVGGALLVLGAIFESTRQSRVRADAGARTSVSK